MSQMIDLSGQRFNRLMVTVIGPRRGGKVMWNCVCDCGGLTLVRTGSLRAGKVGSCGCLGREMLAVGCRPNSHRHAVHGKTSQEYNAWCAMKRRCHCKSNASYHRYGDRGITVCPEWNRSFTAFLKDMGPKPSPEPSLDRINNEGNYEPGNCRWATRLQQARNRRPRSQWKLKAA